MRALISARWSKKGWGFNKRLSPEQPIGIFDSGVGGLTVAHAVQNILPGERIIYFGDTYHLPYGDKSRESVEYYALRITDFLLRQNCKLILIACNTASAVAFEKVASHCAGKALVSDVIDPVVEQVAADSKSKKVGVIGTKGTVNSKTYETRIKRKKPNLKVVSMATPLLVPMIEEGFIFDDISNAIIRAYLSDPLLEGIDTLILGCTHYPIIGNQIAGFFNFTVEVVDSARIVAKSLKRELKEQRLLGQHDNPEHRFYVSDFTDYFEKIAGMFFEKSIQLEKLDFWR